MLACVRYVRYVQCVMCAALRARVCGCVRNLGSTPQSPLAGYLQVR